MFKFFNNKTLIRIVSFALCFFMFFSFTTNVHAGLIDKVKDSIKGAFLDLFDKVLEEIAKIIVSFGDGIVHIMARATGEVVTIDKLVFNKVDKVSIDYWNYKKSNATEASTPIKNYMAIPVQKWYKVFNRIAIMVYMIVLVYIGIAVMLSSTGEKRSKYKELTMTWIIGVTILFVFPYAMKYIIKLNDAMTNTIAAVSTSVGFNQQEGTGGDLGQKGFFDVIYTYGKPEFSKFMGGSKDIITFTRDKALGGKDKPNITLALVYDVLVGQTVVILIMYYKRAFMMAFLIVIFPLVAMSYVIDKIADGKSQSFGIWFKEFMVNVVVQTFHAIVYVLITGGGIKAYLESSGGNFIFMCLCILFLFEGEKILRGIFGMQSQANTMGDLAATGAMIMSMGGKAKGVLGGGGVKTGSSQDNKESTAAQKRVDSNTKTKQENEKAAKAAESAKEKNGESSGSQGESSDSHGEYQGEDKEPEGVTTSSNDVSNTKDKVLVEAMKRRLEGGVAAKAISSVAGATGVALEASRVMATGDITPGNVLSAVSGGKSLGKTFATPLVKGANLVERKIAGQRLASKIESGKMDKDLGINGANPNLNIPVFDDIDENDLAEKGVTRQDVYRAALAAYAKKAAMHGQQAGEEAFFEYAEKFKKK